LKTGKQEKVIALLRKVSEEGKFGSRSRGGGLVKIDIALLLLAIVLVGLGFVLPSVLKNIKTTAPEPTTVANAAPTKDRSTLINEISFYYTQLNSDATKLQQEFTTMLGGGSPDCSAFFNNPTPYSLAPGDASANPDIAQIVTSLNTVQQTLVSVK